MRGAAGRPFRGTAPGSSATLIPASVLADVGRAAGLGQSDLLGTRGVGGGCINSAAALRTTVGTFFLKWNASAGEGFFRAEAEGLSALAAAGGVRTPGVVACCDDQAEVPWLLLEWIEEDGAATTSWQDLGRRLASLHRIRSDESGFGWASDNVIGSLPQPNGWRATWGRFWAENRIRPLARELQGAGAVTSHQASMLERAADSAGDLLDAAASADGASLLHGDLWSGNVLFAAGGEPVLIDPAVYVGHREVDLAMSRLFGGFPHAFYRAYEEAWPLQPGYERRLPAYQLYPLLVHARLFGGGYVAAAYRAATRISAAPPPSARPPPAGSSRRNADPRTPPR
ncbi:MAG: fructosamine kinase family protein [Gemmatimonadetes bacterium]|nr:fructosamine kinase family protein [Gemmatimonadota bacterium]